jgi:uncharacterized protein (DUF2141 family)
MKRSILVLAAVLWGGSAVAHISHAADSTAALTVTVAGLSSGKGNVLLSVFAGKDGFPMNNEKALKQRVIDLSSTSGTSVTTEFILPVPGAYAVAAVHDRDGNKTLSLSLIGMPKEPAGVSNNAKGKMGPPSYEDARFDMTSTHTVTIDLGE